MLAAFLLAFLSQSIVIPQTFTLPQSGTAPQSGYISPDNTTNAIGTLDHSDRDYTNLGDIKHSDVQLAPLLHIYGVGAPGTENDPNTNFDNKTWEYKEGCPYEGATQYYKTDLGPVLMFCSEKGQVWSVIVYDLYRSFIEDKNAF